MYVVTGKGYLAVSHALVQDQNIPQQQNFIIKTQNNKLAKMQNSGMYVVEGKGYVAAASPAFIQRQKIPLHSPSN